MTDTKSILKEARDCIKNKQFDIALKLCKQVLRDDKKNYTALVFMGVSLQEAGHPAKAEAAFRDAIKVNPANPLAWNGLVNYYEKLDTEDSKGELINVYLSLLKIETIDKKLLDYAQKLCQLATYGNSSDIANAIYSLIKTGTCPDASKLWALLVDLLAKVKSISPNLLLIYEEALSVILNNPKTATIEYYSDYLNVLYKQGKSDELLVCAKKMHSLFEIDSISLRWICKIFNETYVETCEMIETSESIAVFIEALLKLEPKSPTALFSKSILLFEQNQFIEAKDLLNEVVLSLPGLLHAWILLLKCSVRLGLIDDAVQAVAKLDKLMQTSAKENLKRIVNLLIIQALSNSAEEEDLERVLVAAQSINDEDRKVCFPHLIRANINLGNFSEANALLSSCDDQPQFILLKAQLLHKQGKFEDALKLLNGEVAQCDWWIEIGTLYRDFNQRDKSLVPFLKAAKLDPNNYKSFLHLGHYYKESNDLDKARRCYEKSFKINSKCAEAGIELSRIYRKLKNWDANFNLLQSLTLGVISKKNSWAWMQLGLNYLEQEEYDKAITNLRFVIRIDQNNMHCWESLADAYLAKGAFTSALKCYEKASELSPSSLYPLLQTATIKQILGEYTEARLNYEEILSSNKLYVPALKGIGETCMYQARECFKNQRLGTSRDHAQYSADKLILAVQQRSDLACLWKLLGDSCLFVAKLPEKYACLLVPRSFVDGKATQGNKILEQDDLFDLAAKCYCKSVSISEDSYLTWHDLAYSYLSHAAIVENPKQFGELMEKALAIAQHCTLKNPTYWQHWNLLGNVAVNLQPPNYRLAQHAFIKTVIADNNSAIGWCNLGTLYLILDEFKLANKAFSEAQRSDPNYVNSWIGQAFLAESLGHEDAMDLFRHSTQLGVHPQGGLGYAHWVCKTLKQSPLDAIIYSIHNMHAIPVACDALTWYTEQNPMNGAAWNMLGMLKERMGLKMATAEAFKNGVTLSGEKYRDLARINHGRILTQLKKYTAAIEMFTKVESATFNSGTGLALALFKDKHYKESYEAYESALHWLTEEQSSQSDLLVALASMAYMFEGPDAAKTLLFQSIQLQKPSPWGFYATIALGLLHNDLNLAQLVFNELEAIKERKECLEHYAVLISYLYLLQGDCLRAIREVSRIIHKHPDQAPLWLTLSSLLIRIRSKAAAKCAQSAMKLGQTDMDVTKVLSLVSLSSLIVGDGKNALLTAQKAVHCYPDTAEAWAVLSSSLLVTNRLDKGKVKQILNNIKGLNHGERLSQWMETVTRVL